MEYFYKVQKYEDKSVAEKWPSHGEDNREGKTFSIGNQYMARDMDITVVIVSSQSRPLELDF